jgi:hypothetical protein
MADYAITGKKGAGKTLFAVGLIRDTLAARKRVATNLDVYPENFGRPNCKGTITRIPDRPTVDDFIALGRGQEGVVEDDNGIIVLDETSTFFNTRSWGDKSRQPMLDWLVHSRKYGWDVYYIMQGLGQVDKQVRDTQVEYHIAVKRTDKWPIPLVTPLTKALGFPIRFPKMHVGIIRHGVQHDALLIGREWYRGKDLYNAYDTQQVFLDRDHPNAVGLHTVLSAHHLKGRYMSWFDRTKGALAGAAMAGLAAGVFLGYTGHVVATKVAASAVQVKPSEPVVDILGVISDGSQPWALFADGSRKPVQDQRVDAEFKYYFIDGKWMKSK